MLGVHVLHVAHYNQNIFDASTRDKDNKLSNETVKKKIRVDDRIRNKNLQGVA